jgi:hypothetical protein
MEIRTSADVPNPEDRHSHSLGFRIYHLPQLYQESNPPIDLPQLSLAVLIVGGFTAIAIARSSHHHHSRAILDEQKLRSSFRRSISPGVMYFLPWFAQILRATESFLEPRYRCWLVDRDISLRRDLQLNYKFNTGSGLLPLGSKYSAQINLMISKLDSHLNSLFSLRISQDGCLFTQVELM